MAFRSCRRRCCCLWAAREPLDPFLTPRSSQSFASFQEDDFRDLEEEAANEYSATLARKILCRDLAHAAVMALQSHESSMQPSAQENSGGAQGSGPTSAWKNCGTSGQTDCWVRIARGARRKETTVIALCNTSNMVPSLPMVRTSSSSPSVGGVSGAVQVLLEFDSWPTWMPMCQSAHVLRRWGPGEFLGHADFRLPYVGLHLEVTIYCCFIDKLAEKGSCEFLFCSPTSMLARRASSSSAATPTGTFAGGGSGGGSGLSGRNCAPLEVSGCTPAPTSPSRRPQGRSESSFLGVPLAPSQHRFAVQPEVDVVRLEISPLPGKDDQHNVSFVLMGEENCPVDWVIYKIWGTLAQNIVPILARQSERTLDNLPAERMAFYSGLEARLRSRKDSTGAAAASQV